MSMNHKFAAGVSFVAVLALLGTSPAFAKSPSVGADYIAVPYPGLDEHYNPATQMTAKEDHELHQLNEYCTMVVKTRLAGKIMELVTGGTKYGFWYGLGGLVGSLFFHGVNPLAYFGYGGANGAAGGIANAAEYVRIGTRVAHSYCMLSMTQKADEIDGKLRRMVIVPLMVGHDKGYTIGPDDPLAHDRVGGSTASEHIVPPAPVPVG